MKSTSKAGIHQFIQLCVEHGMYNVVCSPGSRNAPLVIAIDNHPKINTIVIHDERSAGFYALGMAQQLKEPVGVVCTSGSAMLNYYPAVAEAFYQCVPMVVISADRPEEWINHGDGQTIVQKGVYKNHTRWEGTIKEIHSTPEEEEHQKAIVRDAFFRCAGLWKGPIHFNVPLSDPLYELAEYDLLHKDELQLETNTIEDYLLNQELIDIWNKSSRRMILCGQLEPSNECGKLINELTNDPSVAILSESTSNLSGDGLIACIDRTLGGINEDEVESFHPDLLISIGGAVISKRIKTFLRNSNIKEHWKIGYDFPEMDTYRSLTRSIECDPCIFLKKLREINGDATNSTFGNDWRKISTDAGIKAIEFCDKAPFSDLLVFNTVLGSLPHELNLHLGNSSVVRYCQLFNPSSNVKYFSNRGTSGIDGCLSTACGSALANPDELHVVILGDISFLYDSNALWSNYLGGNLRIIVINNDGGGIFNIIEGPSSVDQLEKFFQAKHGYSAEHLSKSFDVDYVQCNNHSELTSSLFEFYKDNENQRPKLMEIFTPSEQNHLVLREFFNSVASS